MDVDDSGIALTGLSRPEQQLTKARNSRKRGDTIRASDYAKLPAPLASASSAGSASAARSGTRRTRSGTVTQASTSDGGGKWKHPGWPTIKMRTNTAPLPIQGAEEDELLLKDGDVLE